MTKIKDLYQYKKDKLYVKMKEMAIIGKISKGLLSFNFASKLIKVEIKMIKIETKNQVQIGKLKIKSSALSIKNRLFVLSFCKKSTKEKLSKETIKTKIVNKKSGILRDLNKK